MCQRLMFEVKTCGRYDIPFLFCSYKFTLKQNVTGFLGVVKLVACLGQMWYEHLPKKKTKIDTTV